MTEDNIKRIVRDAVYETMNGLGISPKDQLEVQADFHYIRKMRKGSEAMSRNIRTTAITVIIPSFLYLFWQTIKEAISR